MSSIVLQAELLNLPESFAIKLRGKKVTLTESEGIIIIEPVQSVIDAACGMLKGDGRMVDKFMECKRLEKELENETSICA